ncbi:patatin-like phospholipase family protein [Candidatus Poribacteria bacterium]|nr:patatin-like phospholipase family protein [Candidatus Poribacteria bacterium]MYA57968.1 patatin-like phospholipase family protein [Candidatus Poribacteria bacterium]
MNNKDTFHILALDGGGTRGIYTAQLLAKIEQALGTPIRTCFDLIAGTSTGAIIAGAAVSDIPMQEIVELFETETPYIFRRRWYRIPLFLSKYPDQKLAQIIAKHLPATSLSEIETPLMITSSEIAKSEVHIFRSNYSNRDSESASTDKAVSLRDAILASCAAPTFFAPKSVDNFLLADGGLWANNPSTVAFTEALSVFGKETQEIRMLSVGTGHSVNMYHNRRGWGFITGWGGAKLTSYVMTLQSQASARTAKLLLKENYLRINPEIDFWELDSLTQLNNLKSLADRDFERYTAEIAAFISVF